VEQGRTCGLLPLIDVRAVLSGRYLVSLPYLNYGGVVADDVERHFRSHDERPWKPAPKDAR
jgi:hypothetical protein